MRQHEELTMNTSEVALTADQLELVELIESISERMYCAGWMACVEFFTWGGILTPQIPHPHFRECDIPDFNYDLTVREITELRRLSEQIGGWVHWADPLQGGPRFIKRAEWDTIYTDELRRLVEKHRERFEDKS
jgi:hypothetical protein